MDIKKTAKEIGLFETAINLSMVSNSTDVIQKVGDSMPLPDGNIVGRVEGIAKWLLSFDKDKYMFFTPEIALIEEMGRKTNRSIEVVIAIPCDLESEAKERLKNNLPKRVKVTILEEPFFPQNFFPGNGGIVISGYFGSDRAMVLSDTYRMVEHYSSFFGKKLFVPYVELDTASRYIGWMEIKQDRLTAKWREEL